MNRIFPVMIGALLMSCALAAGAQVKPAPKKLFCWFEKGQKVCGDALPTSAVDRFRPTPSR